uniref:Uncharacterized protein n=1 Tax=Ciona intestinalis TaxID=7719 RepID=H2XL50_CIOIN
MCNMNTVMPIQFECMFVFGNTCFIV